MEIYQKHCPYQITNYIQELEFTFDIDRLRKELFKFIIDNKFGFSAVSLRLPQGATNYISIDEKLETGAIDPSNYHYTYENIPSNTTHNREYLHWHPQLVDSYIASLVPRIEKLCGLHIGRVRLAWLQPHHGYNMQYGKLYHLITTNTHTAWNFGKLPRLHLIFSTYIDDIVDAEIDKIAQIDLTSQNFIDTIKNQGVDPYSLLEVFHITESIHDLDPRAKVDMLRDIKQITDLLSKN